LGLYCPQCERSVSKRAYYTEPYACEWCGCECNVQHSAVAVSLGILSLLPIWGAGNSAFMAVLALTIFTWDFMSGAKMIHYNRKL